MPRTRTRSAPAPAPAPEPIEPPTVAPGPAAERTIELKIRVPAFGTPEQAMQSAARIKQMLKVSVHAHLEVELWAKSQTGIFSWIPVGDVHWEAIE